MITLFTTPRPFEEHYKIIQTNALKSWSLLDPKPDRVLVFADVDHEGEQAIEFVKGLGFEVVPVLERSPRGVPLLSDVFVRAEEAAGADGIPCYVNADIILEDSLVPSLLKCSKLVRLAVECGGWPHCRDGALMVARRWNVQVFDYMDFSGDWVGELRTKVDEQGSLMAECAIDLFAWYSTVWNNFQPYAIGRYKWDNWLLGEARVRNIPVIDVSRVIRITHQTHQIVPWDDPDAKANFKIPGTFCGLKNSTHTMTEDGLVDGWLG